MTPPAKLAIRHPDRSTAHQIAGVLTDLIEPAPDALTIFEDGTAWLIEAYFEAPPADPGQLVDNIANMLAIPVPEFGMENVPDENWVALSQAALPPVYAGRFTIYGSHDLERVGRGLNTILIDAGEAFGTAHHATTYGCLLEIDRLTRRRVVRNVLDLGTGTGVLAIALQRALPSARLIATDIDARSVEVAAANARANAMIGPMDQRLQFACAAGLAAPAIRERAPFDLVVANILAGPLIKLAADISRNVETGGSTILSGILVRQAPEVIATYCAHGFALTGHRRYEEWSTLTLVKRDGA